MTPQVITSREELFIGGKWVRPSSGAELEVISPHTEEVVARAPAAGPEDVDAAVTAAREAFDAGDWRTTTPAERIAVVERLAEIYAGRLDEVADLITAEMGSPTSWSRMAQSPGPLGMLHSFIELAKRHPWVEEREGLYGARSRIVREAVGVVGAIAPWNGPQFVAISKIVPALLAGNTVVLKPAPETPLDALLLAEMLEEAGVPPGVVNVIPGDNAAGEHLVRHPGVDKIAFTGSTAAGRRIGAICGEQLKRCTLELGGKSAAIILDDADLEMTMQGLRGASMANATQVCTAQTRILASRSRHDEVVAALAAMVESMPVGDPWDPATEIGPLVSSRQRQRVEGYIDIGVAEGAKLVIGGRGRPDDLAKGWYVRPTIFAGASNDMRIAREEIFGPVLVVIPYDDVDDAIRIANDSDYGLAGTVWTTDDERGLSIAAQVRTGTFGINDYAPDFCAPFGGFKSSGIGREWGSEGLDIYVELKTIGLPK